MAVALVEHQAGSFPLEFRSKGTTLLGHQTPLCGEHCRLNGCPVSLDHYNSDKPISHAISKALPIAHRCLMVSLALRMLPSLLVNGLLLQAFYCVWYHAVREVLFC